MSKERTKFAQGLAFLLVLALLLFVFLGPKEAESHPCTIVYDGSASEPFCRMEQVPGKDGKIVEVYICT